MADDLNIEREKKQAQKELTILLTKEAELRKQIAETTVGYLDALKDYKKLDKTTKSLEKQIDNLKSITKLSDKDKIAQQVKLGILEEQLANLEKQKVMMNEVIKSTSGWKKSLSYFKMAFDDVKYLNNKVSQIYSLTNTMNLNTMDKSIRMSSLSMGLLNKRSGILRSNIKDAANDTIMWGDGISELSKLQSSYSDELGRSALLSKDELVTVSAIATSTGLGAEAAANLFGNFDKIGMSVKQTGDFIEKAMNETSSIGLNTSKVIKNIQTNFKLINKYNFKNGVKGLLKMAETTTRLGVDMNMVAGMTDKLFDIEGAVDMSSQLQVLGGEWSKLADPFHLMYMARNDMAGLTEEIANAAASSAHFNKENHDFEVSSLELQRLRKVAEQTAIPYEELAAAAKKAAQFSNVRKQIGLNIKDDKIKEFIENIAEFNDKGEAVINFESGPKLVKELNSMDESTLKSMVQEKKNAEERAKASRTFDETLTSIKQQFQTLFLPFLEGLDKGLRPAVEEFNKLLKDKDFIDGIKTAAEKFGKVIGFIGEFIAKNPITSLLTGIAAFGLFEGFKWYTMGMSFGAGFNTVAGRGGMGNVGGIFGPKGKMFTKSGSYMLNGQAYNKAGELITNKSNALAVSSAAKPSFGNFAKSSGAIGAGVIAGISDGVFEYMEQKEKGKSTGEALGRAGLKGAGAGLGAWGGAALGAAIGTAIFPGIGTFIGGALGGLAGGALGGKVSDLDTYGIDDGIFGGTSSKRAILQGGQITPIDNKDDLLAMKPGGAVDNAINNAGNSTTNVEFNDLKIKGEVVLTTPGSGPVNSELLKDPHFVKEITSLIQNQMIKNKNGKT
jgi:hypothetical protein